jgi:hypothetical protein
VKIVNIDYFEHLTATHPSDYVRAATPFIRPVLQACVDKGVPAERFRKNIVKFDGGRFRGGMNHRTRLLVVYRMHGSFCGPTIFSVRRLADALALADAIRAHGVGAFEMLVGAAAPPVAASGWPPG